MHRNGPKKDQKKNPQTGKRPLFRQVSFSSYNTALLSKVRQSPLHLQVGNARAHTHEHIKLAHLSKENYDTELLREEKNILLAER